MSVNIKLINWVDMRINHKKGRKFNVLEFISTSTKIRNGNVIAFLYAFTHESFYESVSEIEAGDWLKAGGISYSGRSLWDKSRNHENTVMLGYRNMGGTHFEVTPYWHGSDRKINNLHIQGKPALKVLSDQLVLQVFDKRTKVLATAILGSWDKFELVDLDVQRVDVDTSERGRLVAAWAGGTFAPITDHSFFRTEILEHELANSPYKGITNTES